MKPTSIKPAIRWSEYQQLELIPAPVRRHPSWRDRLIAFFQPISAIFSSEPLQIWLTQDEAGLWWNARDRSTGRSILRVSEAELRVWIEQRYLS